MTKIINYVTLAVMGMLVFTSIGAAITKNYFVSICSILVNILALDDLDLEIDLNK